MITCHPKKIPKFLLKGGVVQFTSDTSVASDTSNTRNTINTSSTSNSCNESHTTNARSICRNASIAS